MERRSSCSAALGGLPKESQDLSTGPREPSIDSLSPETKNAPAPDRDQLQQVESSENDTPAHRDEPVADMVLVIEDEADDYLLLRRALARVELAGCTQWVRTGAEALLKLERVDPSLTNLCLVVDVKLPDMSGFELLGLLRRTDRLARASVVFLTGNRLPSLRESADRCGSDQFFVKPCNFSDLVQVAQAVRELLQAGRAE